MDINKNKNIWIWAIVAVVAILVVWLIVRGNGNTENTVDNLAGEEAVDSTLGEEEAKGTTVNKPKAKAPASAPLPSYAEALVTYKDFRIQLDTQCRAFPNTVTYKNGTTIMIDNRSGVERVVKVGSNYTVKPWGFKLIKLSSSTLPVTWLVDCGSQQNVATILIQK